MLYLTQYQSKKGTAMSALDLRDKLLEARRRFGRQEITVDELYAAADAYIAALKEYKKRSGKKFAIPSRSYVIRAL